MLEQIEEKTYAVKYLYGVVFPEEREIKISTIAPLTEEYIKKEIVRILKLSPLGANQILSILGVSLLETKKLDNKPININNFY